MWGRAKKSCKDFPSTNAAGFDDIEVSPSKLRVIIEEDLPSVRASSGSTKLLEMKTCDFLVRLIPRLAASGRAEGRKVLENPQIIWAMAQRSEAPL